MFWDGRVQSLEAQALAPLRSREEMRGDGCAEDQAIPRALERLRGIEEYRRLFAEAFPPNAPQEAVSAEHLTQAVAAFERSLITRQAPFDRFLNGDRKALSPLAQKGLEVFRRAGCALCHNGPMLSDYKLHVVGVIDPGGDGPREFRTPTLRNLQHTGPYMHNGSLRSLEQVMAFYEQLSDEASETLGSSGDTPEGARLDPLFRKLNLQQDDFPALQAFLESLSVDDYEASVPERVPSGLPVAGLGRVPYSSPSK
jgi:cytochrome c peroxidase